MKDKGKGKIMKGFLALLLCVCFIGFSETLQANEQEYREACTGGNLLGCSNLGSLEYRRGNYEAADIAFRQSCDGGYLRGCNRLGVFGRRKRQTLMKLQSFMEKLVMEKIVMDAIFLGFWKKKEATLRKLKLFSRKSAMRMR